LPNQYSCFDRWSLLVPLLATADSDLQLFIETEQDRMRHTFIQYNVSFIEKCYSYLSKNIAQFSWYFPLLGLHVYVLFMFWEIQFGLSKKMLVYGLTYFTLLLQCKQNDIDNLETQVPDLFFGLFFSQTKCSLSKIRFENIFSFCKMLTSELLQILWRTLEKMVNVIKNLVLGFPASLFALTRYLDFWTVASSSEELYVYPSLHNINNLN